MDKHVSKKKSGFLAKLTHNGKVVKERAGFKTKHAAHLWLENQLEIEQIDYYSMNFFELFNILDNGIKVNKKVEEFLATKIRILKNTMLLRLISEGLSDEEASIQVDSACGSNWEEYFYKSQNHTLDNLLIFEMENMPEELENQIFNHTKNAQLFLDLIKDIPGHKRVFINQENSATNIYEIMADGSVVDGFKYVLLQFINDALETEGNFLIEQIITPDEKALYGFFFKDNRLYTLNPAQLEEELKTSYIPEGDEKIIYKDFGIIFERSNMNLKND